MVRIKVPASTANLGAGFDSLGIALSLYDCFTMEEADGCFISSSDGSFVPTGTDNLVYKSARHLYELCGKPFPGLRIVEENRIPMARGLGSSSACIVGGLFGANELLGQPLSRDALLREAVLLEGHPDNVAPALLGGFTVSALDGNDVAFVRSDLPETLCFAAFIPNFELKTADARAVLPENYSRSDAVYNLSHAALMASSLLTGQWKNLRLASGDRLHQPYRLALIPGGESLLRNAEEQGALASFISGAGSTLLAIFDGERDEIRQKATSLLSDSLYAGWELKLLSVDNEGARSCPFEVDL